MTRGRRIKFVTGRSNGTDYGGTPRTRHLEPEDLHVSHVGEYVRHHEAAHQS